MAIVTSLSDYSIISLKYMDDLLLWGTHEKGKTKLSKFLPVFGTAYISFQFGNEDFIKGHKFIVVDLPFSFVVLGKDVFRKFYFKLNKSKTQLLVPDRYRENRFPVPLSKYPTDPSLIKVNKVKVIVKNSPTCSVTINGLYLRALIDTGSNISLLNVKFFPDHKLEPLPNLNIHTAGNDQITIKGQLSAEVYFPDNYSSDYYQHTFVVAELDSAEVI